MIACLYRKYARYMKKVYREKTSIAWGLLDLASYTKKRGVSSRQSVIENMYVYFILTTQFLYKDNTIAHISYECVAYSFYIQSGFSTFNLRKN